MAGGSCKDLIYSTLRELREQSFKEFKEYLNDEDILKPYTAVAWAELEGKDRLDISGLLIRHYTKEHALNVTLKLLEAIKEVNLAKKLRLRLCPPGVQQEAMMDVESLK